MEYSAIKRQIVSIFQELSPQLRLAARYALDQPDDIALNSMRKAAGLAGVQPATMLRFAQALGFDSYNQFRVPFNNRLRGRSGEYVARAKVLQGRKTQDELVSLYGDLGAAGVDNITEAFASNRPEALQKFCEQLLKAGHIYVLGMRGSYPVAFAFHYGYGMFRRNCTLLDSQGGTFADNLRALREGDVVFAIGFSPYTRSTVRTLDYALEKGATLLALTDSVVSPLSEKASQTLLVPHNSPSFNQSFVAPLAFAEVLVAFLAAQGGEKVLADIEASENQLSKFNAYWEGMAEPRRRPRK